jgi:hypothetical protein
MHDTHAASAVAQPSSAAEAPRAGARVPIAERTQRAHAKRVVTESEGRARSVLKTTRFQREVCCATYSPVLGLIACVSKDSVIRIWDPDRHVTSTFERKGRKG